MEAPGKGKPPRLADWLASKFIDHSHHEEFFGDLQEIFEYRILTRGNTFARLMYWVDTLHLLIGFSSLNVVKTQNFSMMMFNNYLKIAFRNLLGNKAFSFINIFGLVLGMTTTLLILLYVQYELSYDKYHANADKIYRISREFLDDDGRTQLHLGLVAPPYAPLIENDFRGVVQQAVRFKSAVSPLISYEKNHFQEDKFFFADQHVFKVFSWKFISGNPEIALSEPNTLVITASTARKYFGTEEAIGNQLHFNDTRMELELKVTGVIEDIPDNSHFKFDMLCSYLTFENRVGTDNLMTRWWDNNNNTYLLFNSKMDMETFRQGIPDFLDRHMPVTFGSKPSEINRLNLMPLTDIHLRGHTDFEVEQNSNISTVYIFTIIAILILSIACINFMNLSTARASRRSKEVGMRKVMGAHKISLMQQFLMESVIYAFIALAISISITFLVLPQFNEFVSRPLTLNLFENPQAFMLIAGIVIFVGLVAGGYPALYLSSFQPIAILKRKYRLAEKKFNLRSALVVFQFAVSAGLIISVGVIQSQLDYIRQKDPGFLKDNVLVLPFSPNIYNQYGNVQERLMRQDGIREVSLSSLVPSFNRLLSSNLISAEVEDGEISERIPMADVHVDFDYLPSLGAKLVAGRYFDPLLASDSSKAFILNEAAVRTIGWASADEAIGKQFNYGDRPGGTIVGVIKDFHFESLHQTIVPVVFLITSGRPGSILVRIDPSKKSDVEAFLKREWAFWRPGFPVSMDYISDNIDTLYDNEDRLSAIINYFSLLAIFIATLGLLGLASFIAEQRTKEIGVRKVLGASIGQVLYLLTKGFSLLVLSGFLVSIPISWYFMRHWLSDFAYATEINAWPFVLSGVLSLGIALLGIGYHVLKTATNNPVEALRYE